MAEKGYPGSLRKLSEEVNISRERIRSFASNDTPTISVEVIDAICEYYKCDVGSLIVHIKNKTREETV
jgi:DNA-binding Xre family transcriptional regulator